MFDKTRKASAFVALTMTALVVSATAAFAQSASETAIVGAATTLQSELISIGAAVLPLAASVLALTMGWRFAKKFVRP